VHGHVRQKARPGKWVQALVQFRQFWLISMACQIFPLDGCPDSWLSARNVPGLTFQDIFCLATRLNTDFIYRIVTQDETLVHHFDPE
jgi:hypothetical protein